MKKSDFSKTLLAISLATACCQTYADEFHYNNMLIGDRASGMGGAYTAVSDDATGLYYNPAGVVYMGDRNFSASVNAYYSQTKRYKNALGNEDFVRNSSSLLANYFGIVKPLDKLKIGFSYAVPNAVSENQNQTFTNPNANTAQHTINLNNHDNTYNFGPSIATELADNFAAGLTLYVHQRDAQLITNQYVDLTDGTHNWKNTYYNRAETGIRPILGISWAPVEKVSLGMAVSQTLVMYSNLSSQVTCQSTSLTATCDGSVPTLQSPKVLSSDYRHPYPTQFAFGAAYFPSRDLLYSFDLNYFTAVEDPSYPKVATYNIAIGTEYYINRKWAMRAGFYTNHANTPAIQAGVTQIEEHMNLYGLSLSLTNFSGGASVTIGGTVNYGTGLAQIVSDTSNPVQNASTLGWLMFLSSSY